MGCRSFRGTAEAVFGLEGPYRSFGRRSEDLVLTAGAGQEAVQKPDTHEISSLK